MSKIKIGAQVTAKVCPTKVAVSGTFQGYELQDNEDPTSVCGKVFYVKDGMQHLDWVYIDSIKVFESEDERIRRMIVNTLRDAVLSERISETSYREMLDYLEKQKEQKPEEWSEDDEIEHDYLCKLLRETWDKIDKGSCIDNAITWFEKLPERIYQHSWKPSEEQIGILGKVFAGCQLKDSERDSMVDLFYHLKDMI